jgi:hypothetical protein
MLNHFDLWSYNEVVESKHALLARLDAGTMPYDGPGPRRKSSSWKMALGRTTSHERPALCTAELLIRSLSLRPDAYCGAV